MTKSQIYFSWTFVWLGATSLIAQSNVFPSSGNVGIGTTSPSHKLTLQDTYPAAIYLKANTSGQAPYIASYYIAESNIDGRGRGLLLPTAAAESGSAWFAGVPYTGGGFQIGSSNIHTTETAGGPYEKGQSRLFISNSGNVGIGTTAPARKLDVNGDANIATNLVVGSGVYTGRFYSLGLGFGLFNSTGATLMSLNEGGNLGIGTTSPGAKLHIRETDGTTPLYVQGGASNAWISLNADQAFFLNSAQQADVSTTTRNSVYLALRGNYWNGSSYANVDTNIQNVVSGANVYRMVFRTANAERMAIDQSGNVGIGTTSPTHKLAVNGTIRAKEVIVDTGWADYVFADDYRLAPLSEVEAHIKSAKHLPGIPSAGEVAEHGVNMGEMQSKLLAKVEELGFPRFHGHVIRANFGLV